MTMTPLLLAAAGLGVLALSSKEASASVSTPPGATGPGVAPPPSPEPNAPTTPASAGSGDGLAWASQLPKGPTLGRDEAIFRAVERGDARIDWAAIQVEGGGRKGTVYVFARTLRIGQTNPVRVSVNYETAQRICDLLGCAMMTPLVADKTYEQSTLKLAPMPMSKWVSDGTMANTNRMIEYSQKLDARVPVDSTQLTSNESKHWVVTKRFWADPDPSKRWPPSKRSANYGWWSTQAPNGRLWQSTGLVHDWMHVDYSQQLVLMSQRMEVEGLGNVHVGSVLKHPKLHAMLSNEGPLDSWAHPAFGKTSPTLEAS